MTRLTTLVVTALLAGPVATAQGQQVLASVRASEAEVRAMALPERPNRLGHVYGNNVRRLQQRKLCVNCGKSERPLRRYMYLSR